MRSYPRRASVCSVCVVFSAATLAALLWSPYDLQAQEPPGEGFKLETEDFDADDAPPEAREELEELLGLTLAQQKQRAISLIEKYPDTDLARTLEQLLADYESFGRLDEQGDLARNARAAYGRAYWHSRCCPLPVWAPPQAQLHNASDTPVLFQQKLDGLHATVWSGPYRLSPNATYDSPYPFRVRYLTAAGALVREICPGQSYAFQGSAEDGTLQLVPGLGQQRPLALAAPNATDPNFLVE